MTGADLEHIHRALLEVRALSEDDRQAVAALGLPLYESLVVAYLRAAGRLLACDATFGVMERDRTWADWELSITKALDGAMRYRENEPLVVAIGVLNALLPGVHAHASLRGFKALGVAVLAARRGATALKRERSRRRLRLEELVRKIGVWVGPEGSIQHDYGLTDAERRDLVERGFREAWGVVLTYYKPQPVIHLVHAVLPVVTIRRDADWLIAPQHG